MNRRSQSFPLIASVLAVVVLALTGCRGPASGEESSEWDENIITLMVGTLKGTVRHHSEPYVIVLPDGYRMPAPAPVTEFTVAVYVVNVFTIQARSAPEPIVVYEPDGDTLAFTVPSGKEVVTSFEGEPSAPTDIRPIDPGALLKPDPTETATPTSQSSPILSPQPTIAPTTVTPKPTPVRSTVTPAIPHIVAGTKGTNVRTGPGLNFPVTGYLEPGAEARVVGRYDGWWQVDYGGRLGWVFGGVVTSVNTDGVPVVTAPPSPTPVPPTPTYPYSPISPVATPT